MTMPIPSKETIEAQGGHFYREFPFPVPDALQVEYWAFKVKEPQIRHEYFVSRNRVIVFSLPTKGKWIRQGSEPERAVVSGKYDSTEAA